MSIPTPPSAHPLVREHDVGFGWRLVPDASADEGFVWSVLGPGGVSASLHFALEEGRTSCEREVQIPKRVIGQLDTIAEQLAEADLW